MAGDRFVLGMDIGGTNVRLGLVDEANGIHCFARRDTGAVFEKHQPAQGLSAIIRQYLEECGGDKKIAAVSMGFPSTIDKDRKVVLSTPNIASLQNIPIVELMEKEIDLPIYIDRDVNFLMLHDIHIQKVPTDGIIAGFYFGTGLGNAVCIDGKLLKGRNGVAAELGHIPILGDQTQCGCGSVGCLENYAAGKYLTALAESSFPETPVRQMFTRHADHPKVLEFIEYLAVAVAIEATILDPEYLILGGGVIQMPDFPKALLEERIRDRTRKPLPSQNMRFLYSHETQENGVIGAGIHAFQMLD